MAFNNDLVEQKVKRFSRHSQIFSKPVFIFPQLFV